VDLFHDPARAGGIYPGTLPLDRVEVLVTNGNPSRVNIKQLCGRRSGIENKQVRYSIYTIKRSSRNRRIRRWRYNLIPVESKFKHLVLDHQDKYMMKAQVLILSAGNPVKEVLPKLNLPVHRIRRWHYNLIPAESKIKTSCSIIKDKYMMKAQVHVSKSSAISGASSSSKETLLLNISCGKAYVEWEIVSKLLRSRA
nr:hypothetical protein [Tanacetum cinerariifolium]